MLGTTFFFAVFFRHERPVLAFALAFFWTLVDLGGMAHDENEKGMSKSHPRAPKGLWDRVFQKHEEDKQRALRGVADPKLLPDRYMRAECWKPTVTAPGADPLMPEPVVEY